MMRIYTSIDLSVSFQFLQHKLQEADSPSPYVRFRKRRVLRRRASCFGSISRRASQNRGRILCRQKCRSGLQHVAPCTYLLQDFEVEVPWMHSFLARAVPPFTTSALKKVLDNKVWDISQHTISCDSYGILYILLLVQEGTACITGAHVSGMARESVDAEGHHVMASLWVSRSRGSDFLARRSACPRQLEICRSSLSEANRLQDFMHWSLPSLGSPRGI